MKPKRQLKHGEPQPALRPTLPRNPVRFLRLNAIHHVGLASVRAQASIFSARMITSFIFSDSKLVGRDLEVEALRLVRADKGLLLWVDLDSPTDEEIKAVLEGVFQFHPLAIEDCVTPSSLPKIEDYEDYLFLVTHAVDYTRQDKFATTELDLFLGKDYIVTFHRTPLRSVQTLIERLVKNSGPGPRGPDRLAHSLLDLLVDNYAPVMGELSEWLGSLWHGKRLAYTVAALTLLLAGIFYYFFAPLPPENKD